MKRAKASESGIFNYHIDTRNRQFLYQLGGGGKEYCDVGVKARACVDHDRRCAKIARARA